MVVNGGGDPSESQERSLDPEPCLWYYELADNQTTYRMSSILK